MSHSRIKRLVSCAAIGLVLVPSISSAAVVYREVFNNSTGSAIDFNTRGWTHSMTGGAPVLQAGVGAPASFGGNVGQADTSTAIENGWVLAGGERRGRIQTTEYTGTIPLNKDTLTHISLFNASANTQIGLHIALRFGAGTEAVWFYHERFAPMTVGGLSEGEKVEITDFSSSNWTLAITPNRVGVVYNTPLPVGDITAFGVYVTKNDNGSVSARFDNYEIGAVPEPSWVTMASIGGCCMLLRRKV